MPELIGIDIGGTRIRVASDGADAIRTTRTPDRLDDLVAAVEPLLAGLEPAAIGVGCAGLVDHDAGMVRWIPHATGRDLALRRELAGLTGAAVWLDNDAAAAALAEACTGAGAGHRVVLVVTVGTGIGAGLVIDGRVERGRGHLGEVGHMTIGGDRVCVCGRTGCWEEYASGRALDRAAHALGGDGGAWLVEAASAGDAAAGDAVDAVANSLATGIENLALALDPDVIVLGGILAGADPLLFQRVERRYDRASGSLAVVGRPPVVAAGHGDRAGLEGAMIGAREVMG